jgi:hypothetical protein
MRAFLVNMKTQYKLFLVSLLALTVAVKTASAIPLRELIYQEMDKEHHGLLTEVEIKNARSFGYTWFHQHVENYEPLAKTSSRRAFPSNRAKQQEWVLECEIGYLMSAESDLWNPTN